MNAADGADNTGASNATTIVEPSQMKTAKERSSPSSMSTKEPRRAPHRWSFFSRFDLQWIVKNLTVSRLKPVIRSAIAGWISILLVIIPNVERAMGQAGFLIMIAAFLSPPSDPFTAVLERELIVLIFIGLVYGWSCLALKLASLPRIEIIPTASTIDIYSGRYIEAAPAVTCAIFLVVGTSILLYVKARQGPGPFSVAVFLGCTTLDIILTVGALFPYPNYTIVQTTIMPVVFHSAITIACSLLLFPDTVNAQFGACLRAVFVQLSKSIEQQPRLLAQSRSSPDFNVGLFTKTIAASEAALVPLAASAGLLRHELSWGRFGADDLSNLKDFAQSLTVRLNGMAFYFEIMDPFQDNCFSPPLPSRATASIQSSSPSRPPSPPIVIDSAIANGTKPKLRSAPSMSSITSNLRQPHPRRHHSSPHLRGQLLKFHLLHETLSQSQENVVGVFEAQKYLNLETRLRHPHGDMLADRAMRLLGESSAELLTDTANALRHVVSWLERLNACRFWKLFNRGQEEQWKADVKANEDMAARLQCSLREFRETKRQRVLNLYLPALDPNYFEAGEPFHRYLHQCYVYQYHLMQFALHLCAMLDEIDRLEKTRRHGRLWMPSLPLKAIFFSGKWEASENIEEDDDENPDDIPGVASYAQDELGMTKRRNPDALPPGNYIEALGKLAHHSIVGLGRGNAEFSLKAAILTALLSLPSFLPNTSRFAYTNRFNWAIFMAQLTLSRFRGDTAYELVSRLLSSFLGCLVGMIMWYASTGDGDGNSYGLATVSAICFPFLFFVRLYGPAPPTTKNVFLFTTQVVVVFSWQDIHLATLSSPGLGMGLEVAWRRFVLVSAGVTAAFIFSFLPPSTTLRRYIRMTYATTVAEIGQLYCDVVSYGSAHGLAETGDIDNNLIATRMKLQRSKILQTHVIYEFSLEGKWPKTRYDKILKIQMEIAYLLSHLKSVVDHLEPAWTRAFLQRTRFLDSDFQGVVLAVISMVSTALRTGAPLPQITPCPLLDRFTSQGHSLNVPAYGNEDDCGQPRNLTLEMLENEQYLCFSVGVATAFAIVSRLDKLMLSAKELVGEQYHIHGMDLSTTTVVESQTQTVSSV